MTSVRQNDPALPRRTRAFVPEEREIVSTMVAAGHMAPAIVEALAARGFVRSVNSVSDRLYRSAQEAASVPQPPEDRPPYDRLPFVSIQAGCQSFPEAWRP